MIGPITTSSEACHEVWFQEFLDFLWHSQNKSYEVLGVKDCEVSSCIHHHRYIMIPGLLPSQLAQCLVSKLLSCASIGVYLTQIIGQKNTYHMVNNLNQACRGELIYIPKTMLPLPVVSGRRLRGGVTHIS